MNADRIAVTNEARSWLGTPYHHLACVKGVGVDCAMFPIGTYQNALGMLTGFDPRPYSPEWHMHRNEELYLQGLADVGAVKVDQPQPGDIAMFRYGRTVSHGSIVIESDGDMLFAHAKLHDEVVLTRLSELDYFDRLHSFWSAL